MSALKAEIAFPTYSPEDCSWKVTSSILTKHIGNNILLLREMDVNIEEIKQIINEKKSIRDILESKKDMIKKQHLDLEHIDEKINNYIKRRKLK